MTENWFLSQIGPTGCVLTSCYAREVNDILFKKLMADFTGSLHILT